MPLSRKEKELEVKDLSSKLDQYSNVIVWQYHGLDSVDIAKFRSDVKEANGLNRVYKNRLAKIAFTEKGREDINELLVGPNSFLFIDGDNYEPLRILNELFKKNDNLKYTGSYMGGKLISAEETSVIASLPSKDDLISMLLSVMQAPMRNLAYSLAQVAEMSPVEEVETKVEEAKPEEKTEEAKPEETTEEAKTEEVTETKEETTEEETTEDSNKEETTSEDAKEGE